MKHENGLRTLALCCLLAAAVPAPASELPAPNSAGRLQWGRDAKFGMFIHWGIFAIPGRGEWVQWNDQPNRMPRPLKDYIQLLAKVAGRDGNLLLNVGPDRNGHIDQPPAERLREIGAWLDQYGESIYATRGGPCLPAAWGVSTRRDNFIYLHVLHWPGETLALPAMPAKIVKVSALTGGVVQFVQSSNQLEISLPAADHSELDTVLKLELDSPANAIPLLK